MRRASLRLLNEGQVRRVLAAGGMLVEAGGQWRAYRSRDARMTPAGWTTPLIASRLQADSALVADPDRPDRLLAASVTPPMPEAVIPPPARLLQAGKPRRSSALLAELTRTSPTFSSEVTRLKAAALRFQAEINQAASTAPAAALSRLAVLERRLGLPVFRQLECLIVDAADLPAFARQSGCREAEGPELALAALRSLASAYDLALRPPR